MSEFHIQGDEIYFRGQLVMRFVKTYPTLRDAAEYELTGHVEDLEREVESLESELAGCINDINEF